jgi:acetyltransferase-like isoleucine patch superfamily enzyme
MSDAIAAHDFSPWDFWREADSDARAEQVERLQMLEAKAGHRLGEHCFVSRHASVDNDTLQLGDRTYVAAGAYLTGTLIAGADCSINAYAVVRGAVSMGEGVRIGAHSSILGFNHSMEPDAPVFRQPLASEGITLGDDVWVGSHVVILDGVNVGDHSVLAAGAVVTRDVPPGAIVGGNPARFIRWRVEPAGPRRAATGLGGRLSSFADRARDEASTVLQRAWDADAGLFADRPGVAPTVRAQADAIEIADLLLGAAPSQLSAADQIARLRDWQDAATGAVAPLDDSGRQAQIDGFSHPDAAYHVLSVGYALDLLGSSFAAPLTWVTTATPGDVIAFCDGLPWAQDAWAAGHRVDGFGTALMWARRAGHPIAPGVTEALFGWLLTRADAQTGMWGSPTAADGLLPVVNGFYRASRGTFAQFGAPLPHPERVIDTVLRHAADARFFAAGARNACNVLDVAHPLWLTRSTGYRGAEVRDLAEHLLSDALDMWVPGEGFSFREPRAATDGLDETQPGLQGTEMWLAITWYLADLAGVADGLGFRPRGVHRPEPAVLLP